MTLSGEPASYLLDLFCSHIVGLSWVDALKERRSRTGDLRKDWDLAAFAVSAFVIHVNDVVFAVTAGHILAKLEKRLSAGRRLVKSSLVDSMAPGTHYPPIPFMLGETPQWFVDDPEGRDYALIPLRPLIVQNLLAGGIRPLTEAAWTNIPEVADEYYVVGFPSQGKRITLTSGGREGNVALELGTPLLQVIPETDPPEQLRLPFPRFYAKVPIAEGVSEGRPIMLTDIDGMSGGPVFALKHEPDKRAKYWLLAVQSAWIPSDRVLAACHMQPLIESIKALMAGEATDEYAQPLPGPAE